MSETLEESKQGSDDSELGSICEKLSMGQKLSDYEKSIIEDVVLTNKKIYG